mgnify:CR=1 FL=1
MRLLPATNFLIFFDRMESFIDSSSAITISGEVIQLNPTIFNKQEVDALVIDHTWQCRIQTYGDVAVKA